jgi:hypothetical protein
VVALGIERGTTGLAARNSDHKTTEAFTEYIYMPEFVCVWAEGGSFQRQTGRYPLISIQSEVKKAWSLSSAAVLQTVPVAASLIVTRLFPVEASERHSAQLDFATLPHCDRSLPCHLTPRADWPNTKRALYFALGLLLLRNILWHAGIKKLTHFM